jgi:hypothetical protein
VEHLYDCPVDSEECIRGTCEKESEEERAFIEITLSS